MTYVLGHCLALDPLPTCSANMLTKQTDCKYSLCPKLEKVITFKKAKINGNLGQM
jgi:hypothetical protein